MIRALYQLLQPPDLHSGSANVERWSKNMEKFTVAIQQLK